MATQLLCTKADLVAAGMPSNSLAGVLDATIDAAIAKASGYAKSYLQARLVFPLVSWGDDIRGAVAKLAAYELFVVTVGLSPDNPDAQLWKDRADMATRWLEKVASPSSGVSPADVVDSSPSTDPVVGAIVCASDGLRGW